MTYCVISIDEQLRTLCANALNAIGASEPVFLPRFDPRVDADVCVWDLQTDSTVPAEIAAYRSITHLVAAEPALAAILFKTAPWAQVVLKPVTLEALVSQLSNAEHQRANRAATDIVARAARELRAPLNALDGYCELLRDGRVGGALNHLQTDVVEHMHHSILRASRIADGLWSMTSGTDPEWEVVNGKIGDCVHAAAQEIKFLLADRQISVAVSLEDAEVELCFAPRRMQQAFAHVVEYACRCSPARSSVKITGRAVGSDAGTSTLRESPAVRPGSCYRIDVHDSGPAVSGPALALLFADSVPGGDSGPRPASFGLSIARKIIAAHGGIIWAESAGNNGLTISVLLPSISQLPASAKVEAQSASRPLSGQLEGNF